MNSKERRIGRVERTTLKVMGASLVLLGLMGCFQSANITSAVANPQPAQPSANISMSNPRTVDAKLVTANTRFGFKLFAELRKHDRDQNVFVSPSSVALALAMTYNGASGETQQQMAKALEFQGMNLTALNQANANLQALLQQADPTVQLTIANSLWARQGVPFKSDFLERNRAFYSAQVTDLDFANPTATATINDWVKQKTHGKISQIVDALKPDDVMFLINAIYFKGNWSKAFDPQGTVDRPFYKADGSQKTHPLMTQTGKYKYYETDQFQSVSLPYGNQRLSMYIFLPKKGTSLTSFYSHLTAANWQTWMNQFRSQPGTVQIPRFKLEYETNLKTALSDLGMPVAFDPRQATFDGLSNTSTHIDQVKHKTFVEVNEEGTEAAAATSVGIVATSIRLEDPFNLVVDRPFFCAIRDNQTGAVLFMGSIMDPT